MTNFFDVWAPQRYPSRYPSSPVAHFINTCAPIGLALGFFFLTAVPAAAQDAVEPGRFTIGFEQRIRSDDWNNAIDMSDRTNDQRDQLRDRTRLWTNIPLGGNVDVLVGAAMENYQRRGAMQRLDEVFFDQMNVTIHKIFIDGLSLRIGRQDIMKGEGFIILDGTPGDGPRSNYFNAVNLTYAAGKSKIDLMAILDPARDRFLPRLHDQRRTLQTWDEQALGAYFTNTHFSGAPFEAYYFLKKEIHDILPPSNPQFQPDRHVSTLGGRIVLKVAARTDWATEYARQWGAQHGGASIAGWGGYTWVKHTFERAHKPYLKLGYWAMSGDDPKTRNKVEGWDPLFSQWPKWSDMYPYTESREIGTGYWSNLRMSQAEAGFAPFRRANLAFIWYHMNSFHPFAGDPNTFGSGTVRGENYQLRLDFSPGADWKASVHYETHRPGDFYAARSPAYEVQGVITYRFAFHPLARLNRHD